MVKSAYNERCASIGMRLVLYSEQHAMEQGVVPLYHPENHVDLRIKQSNVIIII